MVIAFGKWPSAQTPVAPYVPIASQETDAQKLEKLKNEWNTYNNNGMSLDDPALAWAYRNGNLNANLRAWIDAHPLAKDYLLGNPNAGTGQVYENGQIITTIGGGVSSVQDTRPPVQPNNSYDPATGIYKSQSGTVWKLDKNLSIQQVNDYINTHYVNTPMYYDPNNLTELQKVLLYNQTSDVQKPVPFQGVTTYGNSTITYTTSVSSENPMLQSFQGNPLVAQSPQRAWMNLVERTPPMTLQQYTQRIITQGMSDAESRRGSGVMYTPKEIDVQDRKMKLTKSYVESLSPTDKILHRSAAIFLPESESIISNVIFGGKESLFRKTIGVPFIPENEIITQSIAGTSTRSIYESIVQTPAVQFAAFSAIGAGIESVSPFISPSARFILTGATITGPSLVMGVPQLYEGITEGNAPKALGGAINIGIGVLGAHGMYKIATTTYEVPFSVQGKKMSLSADIKTNIVEMGDDIGQITSHGELKVILGKQRYGTFEMSRKVGPSEYADYLQSKEVLILRDARTISEAEMYNLNVDSGALGYNLALHGVKKQAIVLKAFGDQPIASEGYLTSLSHELIHFNQPLWFKDISRILPYNIRPSEILAYNYMSPTAQQFTIEHSFTTPISTPSSRMVTGEFESNFIYERSKATLMERLVQEGRSDLIPKIQLYTEQSAQFDKLGIQVKEGVFGVGESLTTMRIPKFTQKMFEQPKQSGFYESVTPSYGTSFGYDVLNEQGKTIGAKFQGGATPMKNGLVSETLSKRTTSEGFVKTLVSDAAGRPIDVRFTAEGGRTLPKTGFNVESNIVGKMRITYSKPLSSVPQFTNKGLELAFDASSGPKVVITKPMKQLTFPEPSVQVTKTEISVMSASGGPITSLASARQFNIPTSRTTVSIPKLSLAPKFSSAVVSERKAFPKFNIAQIVRPQQANKSIQNIVNIPRQIQPQKQSDRSVLERITYQPQQTRQITRQVTQQRQVVTVVNPPFVTPRKPQFDIPNVPNPMGGKMKMPSIFGMPKSSGMFRRKLKMLPTASMYHLEKSFGRFGSGSLARGKTAERMFNQSSGGLTTEFPTAEEMLRRRRK